MSFVFTNEEDDDFGSLSNSSNLASIFHDPGAQISNSKSLVYTAPKQPQQNQKPTPSTNDTSQGVVVAAAVTCYKLTSEKYEALPGKIGLALLSDKESKTYQMILYQNKQKPLASVKITSEFIITSQPDNFCTFYDELKQNWAVLFDSKDIAQKFIDEIEHVKSILAGQCKVLSYNSKEVNSQDKTDGPLSTPVENLLSSQESSNKTRLISRIAKLGQPILPLNGVTAADQSDSDQVPIARSSPEVETVPYERPKPKKSARPVPTAAKPTAHQSPVDYSSTLNSVVVPSHQYAPIMAGQQAFPMMQFIPSSYPTSVGGSTQHFDTLMSENRMNNSEIRMHLCRLTDKIDLLLQKSGTSECHPKAPQNNFSGEAQLHALANDLQELQGRSKDHSNKLDLILKGLSTSRSKNEDPTTSVEEVQRLFDRERSAWAENQKEIDEAIQRLKQENERLVHQIEEISSREKDSNARIQQLQNENAQLKDDVETSTRNVTGPSLNHLKEENIRLTGLLDTFTQKENDRVVQQRKTEEKLEYYETKCAETDGHILQLQSLIGEKNIELSKLQEKVKKQTRELSHSQSLIDNLKTKLEKAEEDESKRHRHDTEQEPVDEKIKIIMNKAYKEIMKNFRPDESYTSQSIKSTVSVVIRDVTLAVLSGELAVKVVPTSQGITENTENSLATTETETNDSISVGVADTTIEDIHDSTSVGYNEDTVPTAETSNVANSDPENDRKERSISFLETLHSSLAAASLQNEPTWRPDPPPPPLFDDFDNEDDWLA